MQRTEWRSIDPITHVRPQPVAKAPARATFARPSRRIIVAAAGSVAVVATVAAILVAGSWNRVKTVEQTLGSIQTQVRNIERAPVVVTPTPLPCTPAITWLETIAQQERASQWSVAASNARTVLTSPGLCPNDRAALAQHTVADDFEALFAEPFSATPATQQQAIDRYQSISRFAQEEKVALPSARQVAGRAYDAGQFALAIQAFEDALAAREITTTDQEQVRFFASSLFNLGKWWTTTPNGDPYDRGLRLLAASNCIDRKYRLGLGTAWGELSRLLGPDESRWPQPAQTPLWTPGDSCTGD